MVVSRQGHVASCPEPSGVTRQKIIPWTYWKDPTRFHDVASFQSAVHFNFYSWKRYFSYWFNLLAVWFTNNEVHEETENSKIWTSDLQLEVTQCRMAQNLPVPLGTRLVAAAAGWLRLGGPVFWPSATGLLGTVSTMSRVADFPFWTFMNPANSSIVYICRIHTQPVDFPNPLTSGMNINHGTETVSNFLLRLLSVRRASSSRCFHWWGWSWCGDWILSSRCHWHVSASAMSFKLFGGFSGVFPIKARMEVMESAQLIGTRSNGSSQVKSLLSSFFHREKIPAFPNCGVWLYGFGKISKEGRIQKNFAINLVSRVPLLQLGYQHLNFHFHKSHCDVYSEVTWCHPNRQFSRR